MDQLAEPRYADGDLAAEICVGYVEVDHLAEQLEPSGRQALPHEVVAPEAEVPQRGEVEQRGVKAPAAPQVPAS
jgi:hypothetical protein